MRSAEGIDQKEEIVDSSQEFPGEPGTQEGWRVHAWGAEPVWERFARPEPGQGEVLVQVYACGVGLTVLNALAGDLGDGPAALPRVPGHELVGSGGPGRVRRGEAARRTPGRGLLLSRLWQLPGVRDRSRAAL